MARVAINQFAAEHDVRANLEQIKAMAGACARKGARMAVFPEGALYQCLSSAQELAAAAEPMDGLFVSTLAQLSAELGIVIVAGMFEANPDGRPYNTLAVVGDGALIASHRKALVYDAFGYRESDAVQPAPAAADVFGLDELNVGLVTCYEVRFPECSRALVDAGADVLVVCSAWPLGPAKEEHWSTMIRARAIENTVYVVAADDCSPGMVGRSHVVDPLGYLVAGLGEQPGTATADLDRSRLSTSRQTLPLLAQRRAVLQQASFASHE
jgi:predicted amidohydrolase